MLVGASCGALACGLANLWGVAGPRLAIRQGCWAVVGGALGWALLSVNYRMLRGIAHVLYLASLLPLLLLVGQGRWIRLGPLSAQPSELTRTTLVLSLARCLEDHPSRGGRCLLWCVLILLPAFGLILAQPHLGGALLCLAVFLSLLFVARVRYLPLLLIALTLAIPWGWRRMRPYQRERIRAFLFPQEDPWGRGYQIMQSKIAIGAGGLWGRGFGGGTQSRLGFLPAVTTDFAFAAWAEQWGWCGGVGLLAMYALLTLRGFRISAEARDEFARMACLGLTLNLLWQALVNVAMNLGLLPVVGVPLPLFGYGGSSMVTSLGAVGLLLNVHRRRYIF